MSNTDGSIFAFDDDLILSMEDMAVLEAGMQKTEKTGKMVCAETVIDWPLEQIHANSHILFMFQNRMYTLRLSEDTSIIRDGPSNRSYIFFRYDGDAVEEDAECIWAMSEADAQMFSKFERNQKETYLHAFANMLPAQREYVRKRHLLPEQNCDGYHFPISSQEGLQLLFALCGKTYSPDIQVQADALMKELKGYGYAQKGEILKRLSYLLNDGFEKREVRDITYDEVIRILDKHVYGMQALKRVIAERIMLLQRTGKALSGILLVGNPGVGKSSFGRAVSECYGLPLEEIRCEGADPLVLKGLVSSYAGSKPGNPARLFYQRGSKRFVLLFEEIDKMCDVSERGDPYSVFATMLGSEKILHDEFVDADMDVSDCVILATCNDQNRIPAYIKDRFNLIITVDDLLVAEKVIVGRDYVLPRLFAENRIAADELLIDDTVLEFVARRYCHDHGARRMNYCLETIICAVASDWSRGLIPIPFAVTQAFVKARLDDIIGKQSEMGFAP